MCCRSLVAIEDRTGNCGYPMRESLNDFAPRSVQTLNKYRIGIVWMETHLLLDR